MMYQQFNKDTLLEAWKVLKAGTVYVIYHKLTGLPLLEPDVSDLEVPQIEALVRMFMTRHDAQRYKEIMSNCGLAEYEHLQVKPVDIAEIFSLRQEIFDVALKDFDSAFRVDICIIQDIDGDEWMWPLSIDTILCNNDLMN